MGMILSARDVRIAIEFWLKSKGVEVRMNKYHSTHQNRNDIDDGDHYYNSPIQFKTSCIFGSDLINVNVDIVDPPPHQLPPSDPYRAPDNE
jgi:hypothetical protein